MTNCSVNTLVNNIKQDFFFFFFVFLQKKILVVPHTSVPLLGLQTCSVCSVQCMEFQHGLDLNIRRFLLNDDQLNYIL